MIFFCLGLMLMTYLWMRRAERGDTPQPWPAAITWNEPYVGYVNVACRIKGFEDICKSLLFLRDKNASICLPAFASGRELSLDFDEKYFELYINGTRYTPGSSLDITDDAALKILYSSDAYGTIERDYHLSILRSENLPALYLTTASGSMEHMDADKEHLDSGRVTIIDSGGRTDTAARISFMHAKGQSSFTLAKKSYKLELERDTSLLGLPFDKKWVLVANAMDASFMRNALAYSLADKLEIEDTVQYRYVDAFFNGEYRGNYLLTQVADHGFMEKYGNNPEDFLLEVETWEERLKDDSVYLKRGDSTWLEFLWPLSPREDLKKSASAVLDKMDRLSGADTDLQKETGVDFDSFARKYILDELTNEPDSNSHSTFYFYSPEHGGFHAAPVWDYDRAWGNRPDYNKYPEFASFTQGWQQMMMRSEYFRKMVKEKFAAIRPYLESVPRDVIPAMAAELEASVKMDYCINGDPISSVYNAGSFDKNVRYLADYYRQSFISLSDYLADPNAFCTIHFISEEGRSLRLKKNEPVGNDRLRFLKNLYKCDGFETDNGDILTPDQCFDQSEILLKPVISP